MRIRVWCDSGANRYSRRWGLIDLKRDWGLTDKEWLEMPMHEQEDLVWRWAVEKLRIGWTIAKDIPEWDNQDDENIPNWEKENGDA